MTIKRGLGKGLDALFESLHDDQTDRNNQNAQLDTIRILDIDSNPSQPRKYFDDDKISELAESIKIHGVVQPIVVKPHGSRYLLIAGERRWRAARLAGLTNIPAIKMDLDDRQVMEIGLIENLQREDLNPIEESRGIRQLLDEYKLTQEEVASHLGRSRPAVANALRLLNLSDTIQQLLMEDKISAGHARALLSIDNQLLREEIAKKIIEKALSVRETEKMIKELNRDKQAEGLKAEKPTYITEIETNLEEALGTRVQITPGRKKGVIQIEYYNNDDLERIIDKVNKK